MYPGATTFARAIGLPELAGERLRETDDPGFRRVQELSHDDAERLRDPPDQRDDESKPRRVRRGSPANRSSRRAWRWRVGARRASSRIPAGSPLSDRRDRRHRGGRAQEAAREFNVSVATVPVQLIRPTISIGSTFARPAKRLRARVGGARSGQHVLCEKPVDTVSRHPACPRFGQKPWPQNARRPHVSFQSGDARHAPARRRGLHRHTLFLQRQQRPVKDENSTPPRIAG